MKCVFISCFDNYDTRIKHIERYYIEKNYDVEYITSNYDHIKKKKYEHNSDNTTQIKVLEYKNNLSLSRLISHYYFSKKAFDLVEQKNPDVIYVMLPPNSLARFAYKYKRKRKETKLIFDIFDLWPESFPFTSKNNIMKIPFYFWRKIRNQYLDKADIVLTECNLFREILCKDIPETNFQTLYLAKDESNISGEFQYKNEEIEICYLGSINNIIDISTICNLLNEINKKKKVILNIIGDGERRDEFIDLVEKIGVVVVYHGKIYDEFKKKKIFDRCYFGLNMMKESVSVGLTLKSLDYFQLGLPILNNIKADTHEFVEKFNLGYNVSSDNIIEIATLVSELQKQEILVMRQNTKKIFSEYFSTKAFDMNIKSILDKSNIGITYVESEYQLNDVERGQYSEL